MIQENNIQKANETNLTLTERLKLRRSAPAILLDISGSMSSDVEPGKSKINALREIVQGISGNSNIFWFGTNYGKCTKDTIPNPNGSTNLAALLEYIKSIGIRSCIILTDGDISDKQQTIISKENLSIKVMYIGADPRPAFLNQLASSGFATTEDLKQTKQLTEKIQLLLGSGEEKKGGAICL